MTSKKWFQLTRVFIHIAAFFPAGWLIVALLIKHTGPNPVQYLEVRTGDYALILLFASLACTPFRIVTGIQAAVRFRRALGLYAFAYSSIHLLLYVWLDFGFMWGVILQNFLHQRYLWFGLATFVILLALALTSSQWSQRKLKKHWRTLHSLVYVAGLLVILHYALSLKGNIFRLSGNILGPLIALAIITLLFLLRLDPIRHYITRLREKKS